MLPKQNRLRSADFKKMRAARVLHSPHFLARLARGAEPAAPRAAAVVSARIARTAVKRNLLRRRIYAALRSHFPTLQGSLVVVTAKQGAPALSFKELQGELSELLQRI